VAEVQIVVAIVRFTLFNEARIDEKENEPHSTD
jgi:hypothetical protein